MIGKAGPYTLLSRCGIGGMGEVYSATGNTAVKKLRPEYAGNSELAKRFCREISIASKLRHEFICPIIDFGETTEGPYYVMPYLEGETLYQTLKKGPIEIHRTVTIMQQVLQALSAAHRSDIVHRDLKPSNIFLTLERDKEIVQLLDFGISKQLEQNQELISTSSIALGTISYMAPEQIDSEHIDHRVDIYAAGVVLYEMLTGEKSFNQEQLFKKRRVVEPRRKNPNVPKAISNVAIRAMERNPKKRYGTADEMHLSLVRAIPNDWSTSGVSDTTFVTRTANEILNVIRSGNATYERKISIRKTVFVVALGVILITGSVTAYMLGVF